MPVTLFILDDNNKELAHIAEIITHDFTFTNQFSLTIRPLSASMTAKELHTAIKQLCPQGIPLALCINSGKNDTIVWKVYDTMQCTLLGGKAYKKRGPVLRAWAHTIADTIICLLTGNEGYFSSRIAYCKDSIDNRGKKKRHIYIADYDGSNAEKIVDSCSVTLAPRWNNATATPRLYFSEFTDTNLVLKSVSMNKNITLVSNLHGTTMLPTCSPDGKAITYCASHGTGNCQLYYQTKDSITCFTRNMGNNIAPIFIDNETLCFCSDAQIGSPQIYIGNLITGHVNRITKGGYCTSPSYCAKNKSIAYSMKVGGVMQISIYNCSTKQHKQITFDNTHKHEVSWSPDGTRLLYAQEAQGKSCLISHDLITTISTTITPKEEYCSYPHWSPRYSLFPVIV